jgi:ABC-type transporter Mla MlaB component
MAIELIPADGNATLVLSGNFDAAAVAQLCRMCDRLAQTDSTRTIVLDFYHVRNVADVALAALVQYQPHVPCRLRIRGLSQHQSRVLRYLRSNGDGVA